MRRNLTAIQAIDPAAEVKRIERGPEKGKYYLSTDLMIPPRSAGESPAASTPAGAIAAYWGWIEALKSDKWITVPGIPNRRSDAYRWNGTSWTRR